MPRFDVDDDLVDLVNELAKPKPFESFSDALRRVLPGAKPQAQEFIVKSSLEELIARAKATAAAMPKKVPSPSATDWAASVPELRTKRGLSSWKAICLALKIDPAGDSARRKLKAWVAANRPSWPQVPDAEAE